MKMDKASLMSQHFLIVNSVQRYTQSLHILKHTSLTYSSFAIIRSRRHLTNEVRMETAQMKAAVNGVESIIGYVFHDRFLLWEALQAAGSPVVHAGGRSFRNGNKRLAVLGDTVLQLVLVEQWYAGEQARGTITTVTSSLLSYRDNSDGSPVAFDESRQRIGSNDNLTIIGNQTGLNAFVNRAGGMTVISPTTMAATVEAVLGAVYLDGSLQAVTPVMQTLGLV